MHISSLTATPAIDGVTPTMLSTDGKVIIVGTKALLEARLTSIGRELTVYGRPGTYFLQYSTNLANPVWTLRGQISIPSTNLFRVVPTGNTPSTNVNGIFRVRQ
jgi:hypothetical protein